MRWKLSEEQRKRDLHGRQEALERDLEDAVSQADDLARAVALNNLGAVHADLEEWAEALARYEEAASIVPADAPLAERATPHGNAAAAARQLDDHAAALRHALWVDALGTQAGDAEQQAVADAAVALVRKAVGDEFAAAVDEATAALPEELRSHVRKDAHLHPTVQNEERPGRNDPCWCGSGKRYKHCHLKSDGG